MNKENTQLIYIRDTVRPLLPRNYWVFINGTGVAIRKPFNMHRSNHYTYIYYERNKFVARYTKSSPPVAEHDTLEGLVAKLKLMGML